MPPPTLHTLLLGYDIFWHLLDRHLARAGVRVVARLLATCTAFWCHCRPVPVHLVHTRRDVTQLVRMPAHFTVRGLVLMCHFDAANGLPLWLQRCGGTLTDLQLSGSGVTSLQGLMRCPQLRRLSIRGCWRVTSLQPIAACASLRSLSITGGQRSLRVHVGPACRHLHIASRPSIGIVAAPGLRTLHVHRCYRCTHMFDEQSRFVGLTKLCLIECRGMTGHHATLACPALVELDLRGCVRLASISRIVGHSPRLAILSLRGCTSMVDISALASCPRLLRLDLGECVSLTTVGPLAGCTRLADLSLFGCAIDEIEALGACTGLQRLDVSHCYRLRSVRPLRMCHRLRSLNLSYCHRIVDAACMDEAPHVMLSRLRLK